MSRILLFTSLLVLSLLQFTLLPRYAPFGAAPDLVFVVLFYSFLRVGLREALIWTMVFGLIMDILAIDPLGAHPLAMVPLVMAAQPLLVRPWLVNPISCVALVMMASLFNSLFLGVIRGGFSLFDVIVQLGYHIAFATVGYWVYRRFYKR